MPGVVAGKGKPLGAARVCVGPVVVRGWAMLSCVAMAACGAAEADRLDAAIGADATAIGTDAGTTGVDAAGATPPSCTRFSDPQLGRAGNDGTRDAPWAGLDTVVADGELLRDGDVVCLRSGAHGAPLVRGLNFADGVTFVAEPGAVPVVSRLRIEQSSRLSFVGFVVDGSAAIAPDVDEKEQFLVTGDQASHHIAFRRLVVRSAISSEAWTKSDWYLRAMGGLDMRGTHITVEGSTIVNTYHALSVRGDHARVAGNVIDNFAGDGIRGLGSFSLYEDNVVRDAYVNDYDIQHDDAFQAFDLTADPKVEGVVIRRNRFVQFLDPITDFVISNDLMSRDMQGIIITDGYADGWVVENNLVVTNHFHGITLYGARHCRVQNNTVVQPPFHSDTDVPWIRLTDQTKTGHANFDNVVRNNLAARFTPEEYDATSVAEHNTDMDETEPADYRRHFRDYDGQDYRLSATSPAVNAGTNQDAAAVDLDGNPRIRGGVVDTGAFELQPAQETGARR